MNFNNKKGTALVETAIILPLLLLILFGVCEFGRVMFITNALNNAAREGARRAAVTQALPININSYVTSCISPNIDTTGITITTNPTSPASGTGTPVTVMVTLPFQTVTPVLLPMLNNIILQGAATMRYEY